MTSKVKTMKDCTVRREIEIPMGGGKARFYTFHGLSDGKEHLVLGFGNWEAQAQPLVRLHSECLTGDVFGSGKCDCGEQLRESIDCFQRKGGLLVYLRQEGRGMGLYNKLDAYALQQLGVDTFMANEMLGFPADMRCYASAAQMLKALGVSSVRLMTNNPEKSRDLEAYGVKVAEVVPTGVYVKAGNLSYLMAKQRSGHNLSFTGIEA